MAVSLPNTLLGQSICNFWAFNIEHFICFNLFHVFVQQLDPKEYSNMDMKGGN